MRVMTGSAPTDLIARLSPTTIHVEIDALNVSEGDEPVIDSYTVPPGRQAVLRLINAVQIVRVAGATADLDAHIYVDVLVDDHRIYSLDMLSALAAAGSHQTWTSSPDLVLGPGTEVEVTACFEGDTAPAPGRARQRITATLTEFGA